LGGKIFRDYLKENLHNYKKGSQYHIEFIWNGKIGKVNKTSFNVGKLTIMALKK